MKVETRRRFVVESNIDYVWYDIVLIAESEEESSMLDLLGCTPNKDGVCSTPSAEVRLSTDVSSHYVILKGDHERRPV